MITNEAPKPELSEVMSKLREAGVVQVRIPFSGGNDEGHADECQYLDGEGESVPAIAESTAYQTVHYDDDTKNWVKEWVVTEYRRHLAPELRPLHPSFRPATPAELEIALMQEVLEAPIYERFGSFAGEFYVDGTVLWNVTDGTYKMFGQESVQSYESFEYASE